MTATDQVIDRLSAVADALARARGATTVAAELCQELYEGVTALGASAAAADVVLVLGKLDELAALMQATATTADETLATARAVRDEDQSGPAPSGSQTAQAGDESGRPPVTAVPTSPTQSGVSGAANRPRSSRRPDPTKVAEIIPHVPPPDAKHPPAVGKLYDGDGQPLTGLYGSGTGGPADGGPGLKEPYKSLPSLTEHVEGHAAAIMRRDNIQEATLYLNMRPCRGPKGCDENLEASLPDGSALTVHQVYATGSTRYFRYVGTGEGVADEPGR